MNKTSRYLGVSWSKSDKKWTSFARIAGKKKYIGSFDCEKEASKAYLSFTGKHHQRRRYTERDKTYVRNNYMNLTDKQIGQYLHRSEQGIKALRERIGLHKTNVEMINFIQVSRVIEMNALRNYISLGKGGQVAKDRLNELESIVKSKPRIHKTRKRFPLKDIANVYELYKSGMAMSVISKETGIHKVTIWNWINSIKPYKGRSKKLMVLDSRINGTD